MQMLPAIFKLFSAISVAEKHSAEHSRKARAAE
jgi:hypothetical protein